MTHHDDGRLEGGQHGEKQVQKNKRIGIPSRLTQKDIGTGIPDENHNKGHNEGPGTAKASYRVGDALAQSGFLFDHLVRTALGAKANQLVCAMEMPTENRQQIQSGERLPL
jgi:CobQ-like glutamine amidotransferase family enzyme